jgi:hypothetical protein
VADVGKMRNSFRVLMVKPLGEVPSWKYKKMGEKHEAGRERGYENEKPTFVPRGGHFC